MVYYMTETNLWPLKPEMWECFSYKGSVAALPRYNSAVCPAVVRRTFAVGHVGLAFMIMLPLPGLWSPEAGSFHLTYIEEVAVTRRFAVATLLMFPCLT
jgi:hypothetical protein